MEECEGTRINPHPALRQDSINARNERPQILWNDVN